MLEFFDPATLDEAVALGGRFGADANFVAGGTDLVIQMRRGRRSPQRLVSLHRLTGLGAIDVGATRVLLGSLATHRAMERHPAFGGALRALVESAEVVGGHQVRNVGTLGGNLCNASPAADLAPILLALDATVRLRGAGGARELALASFLQGPGRTLRAPGEVLEHVSFGAMPPRSGTAFIKFGRRRAMEISLVAVAAAVTLDASGRCTDARIALGAVAPTAIRVREAEGLLCDARPDPAVLRAAGHVASRVCEPLSDVRASSAYRRRLVETLVARAVAMAVERASSDAT